MKLAHATKATPKSAQEIRAIAQGIRDVIVDIMDRGKGGVVYRIPMLEVFESLSLKDEFVMAVVDDGQLPDACAETTPDQKIIKLRESLYLAACNGDRDSLFTLAHELGHLYMHADQPNTFARGSVSYSREEDCEWQADQFASELLIDRRLLQTDWSIMKVIETFGVEWKLAKKALDEKRWEEMLAKPFRLQTNPPPIS